MYTMRFIGGFVMASNDTDSYELSNAWFLINTGMTRQEWEQRVKEPAFIEVGEVISLTKETK